MTSEKVHPWIYVIIPVQPAYEARGEYTRTPASVALFAAFCKDCRTYFSEPIPWSVGARIESSSLPRTGCGVAESAEEGFSSLPGVDR